MELEKIDITDIVALAVLDKLFNMGDITKEVYDAARKLLSQSK